MKHATQYYIIKVALGVALGGAIGTSRADTLNVPAAADTFINSGSPTNSAGGSPSFDAGTDGQATPGVRRGLVRFDLTSVPSGVIITSAVVQLTVIKVPGFGPVDSTFDLRRLTAAWGEGTNTGNSGAPAVAGDATWTARILGTANWTVAGALSDAAASASASTPVGSTLNASYLWTGAGLLSDVQSWLNSPSQNFGWLLTSRDEATARTVRGFGARESGASGPVLQIGYTPTGNQPPVVTITNPVNGASFTAPASVTIQADAHDPDGSVTNVSFFDGLALLGGTNNTPYAITASLAAGGHALTAVATDNLGLSATSAVVNITVGNTSFTVTITNPPDGAVFGNTDSVNIGASASGSAGAVTNVQFFDGSVLLRSVSASPYTFSTAPFTFALGLHTLTAVAADNLGATATSGPVHLTVARYTPEITNGLFSVFLLPVATNLSAPLYGISPPGDTHRLFVLDQNGLMRVIQDGVLLPAPALDIQSRVQPPLNAANPNDERGLLGLAFHPGFNDPASPGYQTLYTYNSEMIPAGVTPTYICPNNATNNYMNVVNEWKISPTNANVIDPSSRRAVISFGKNAGNHNGGTITFGPDGYAYLALGDGGNANDVGASHIVPGGNAQNLTTPLGKMLRFDPLDPALNPSSPDLISSNGQYRIPASNPFLAPGEVPEIYAYGLRNPYRFAFDTATGDLIEADVGQNNIEEINRITRGGNYGWAVKEGDFLFNMTNGPAGPAGTIGAPPGHFNPGSPAGLIDPISGPSGILEYDHNNGISITGGFVYRGSAMPELYGKYIFGDLALIPAPVRINGRLFYADLQAGTINVFTLPQFGSQILPAGQTVHGFGQDASGELYAMATDTPANGNGGVVYKLLSFRLTARVSGNQLDLSWPIAGVRLQAQTSSPGGGITANWSDVPGSTATNHVVVPIGTSDGSAFFRLATP